MPGQHSLSARSAQSQCQVSTSSVPGQHCLNVRSAQSQCQVNTSSISDQCQLLISWFWCGSFSGLLSATWARGTVVFPPLVVGPLSSTDLFCILSTFLQENNEITTKRTQIYFLRVFYYKIMKEQVPWILKFKFLADQVFFENGFWWGDTFFIKVQYSERVSESEWVSESTAR